MNLDELQSVRDRERQTDKLQQLRETFYEDAGEFIQQLRDQRGRAADRADDPFDAPEVSRLSDEIDTAEQTVEAIYEKRVGKIVKAASFAAADLPAESDGMTAEEQDLFETLVENIKKNRNHVKDVLDGSVDESPVETGTTSAERPVDTGSEPGDESQTNATATEPERATPPDPVEKSTQQPESGVSAADAMGSGGSPESSQADPAGDSTPVPPEADGSAGQTPPDPPEREPEVRNDGGGAAAAESQSGVERETVRITADVGDFLGFDEREYDLSENDVVTLPATNVEPLVSRDAAERLD